MIKDSVIPHYVAQTLAKPNLKRLGQGGLRLLGKSKTDKPELPLVSIITAVYNGETHIEETIQTVIGQDYANLEYIIIDGGSTDRTLEIIKKYDQQIDYWVSENDSGIGNAFNKGINLAAGTYINFQGDGDGFIGSSAVSSLQGLFLKKPMFVSGRIRRVDIQGNKLYDSKYMPTYFKESLLFRMSLPHQGLFTHVDMFKIYGLFDEKNKFCMDYDHLLRAYKKFPEVLTSPEIVAKWRADGLGNGKIKEILREYHTIKVKNDVAPAPVLWTINQWSFFKNFIKKSIGKG